MLSLRIHLPIFLPGSLPRRPPPSEPAASRRLLLLREIFGTPKPFRPRRGDLTLASKKFFHIVKNRFTITANNMKSQEKMKIYVDIAYNDKGRRIGSGHPRAKFTDADVEHVLMLRTTGMTTREIADKMEMSESTVRSYIRGVRRSQPPMAWKRKEIVCGK